MFELRCLFTAGHYLPILPDSSAARHRNQASQQRAVTTQPPASPLDPVFPSGSGSSGSLGATMPRAPTFLPAAVQSGASADCRRLQPVGFTAALSAQLHCPQFALERRLCGDTAGKFGIPAAAARYRTPPRPG